MKGFAFIVVVSLFLMVAMACSADAGCRRGLFRGGLFPRVRARVVHRQIFTLPRNRAVSGAIRRSVAT